MTTTAVGRNETCPCGSGKKYKRCHGMNQEVQATSEASTPNQSSASSPFGIDPSQFDPAMLAQFSQSMQRLPKGQLQQFQMLMSKAMAGKDVANELATLQSKFPMDFQKMIADMPIPDSLKETETEANVTSVSEEKSESRFGRLWKKMTGKKNE